MIIIIIIVPGATNEAIRMPGVFHACTRDAYLLRTRAFMRSYARQRIKRSITFQRRQLLAK